MTVATESRVLVEIAADTMNCIMTVRTSFLSVSVSVYSLIFNSFDLPESILKTIRSSVILVVITSFVRDLISDYNFSDSSETPFIFK